MEVAVRKKRFSSAVASGLGNHSNPSNGSSSSLIGMGLASAATRRSLTGGKFHRPNSTLSFYNQPPQEEITMDQFEQAGVDRLQALKQMENIRLKKGALLNNKNKVENDPSSDPFAPVLAKYNLENAQWDNLSHFVLRLAYCKTEELRRWMLTQESALFKYRFDNEKEENISQFLKENDLNYQPLDDDELNAIVPRETGDDDDDERVEVSGMNNVLLRDVLRQVPFADIHQSIYYKVPFEDAIDLLRERKVYLRNGFAFVSRSNLSAIITTKFRARLSQNLSLTCRATSQIKQDVRIVPLLNMLGKQYITPMYKVGKVEGAVTKEQLPILAERSMPLCMNTLYHALKSENHLKHGGRMQFGLFLKGIGLSLSDALAFWKQSFARRTPPEKFDKEYAYNIRHNYGQEGKRTTYTPYGCVKIINSTPGPGDHHGCPFKQFEEGSLRQKMKAKNFTPIQMEDVLTLVKGHHYQIACQRWYQYTHGNVPGDNVGSHPNAYFDDSENYWRSQQEGNASANGNVNGNGSVAASHPSSTSQSVTSTNTSTSTGSSQPTSAPSASSSSSSSSSPPPPPASDATNADSEPAPMEIVSEPTNASEQ